MDESDYDALLTANAVRVFSEPDEARRRQALEELWQPDGTLYEAEKVVAGIEAISASVSALLAMLPPGTRFAPDGAAVGHHGLARLRWRAVDAAGHPGPVTGTDVAVIEDGRIASLYVLLDPRG